MTKRLSIIAALVLLCAGFTSRAQNADISFGYRLGQGVGYGTSVFTGYAADAFGDTYARADFGFDSAPWALKSGYLEIARSICLLNGTALRGLGLHGEFNGHLNMGNSNWLLGVDYTLPGKDLMKVSLMYMTFNGNATSLVPVQLSFLWRFNDILGVNGLQFRGLFKVWGEETTYWYGESNPTEAEAGHFIIKATPQLWYSVGQLFGLDCLSIGGEVELSYNYLGCSGFYARPMAGLRLSF